jgi:hypothetical protein
MSTTTYNASLDSEIKKTIEEYSNSEEKTSENQYYENASITSEKTNETSITVKKNTFKASRNYQNRKQAKLNRDISWFYWKKYIASAFWSQLSTPVNLSITLMTALTTAQANAPDLLDNEIYKKITIATLILTVINTFFRPHEKAQHNKEYMKRWNLVGIEFEKVYYSKKSNIVNSCADGDDAVADYEKVEEKVNELRQKEGPDVTNFVVDFIHLICYLTCLKKYRYWVVMDKADY